MVEKSVTVNIDKIREDFPILRRQVNGKPLVYLDNAATTQKPERVIQALVDYYRNYNANVRRGIHKLAEEATLAHENVRGKVARFINAERPEEIVYVRNSTEAINLVAWSWGRANIREGDKIVLTIMEHHSNIVPWQLLAREKGAKVEFIGIDSQGRLKQDDIYSLIDSKTKMVCVTEVSNVLGTVNPVGEVAKVAHQVGARVLVDAAQSVPHMPVDVGKIHCDFLAFSGHKMLGPTGIGILYGKMECLDAMPPFMGGGEMIREVHTSGASWQDPPYKFEAGTPDVAGAIGLGAAIDYLNEVGMENVKCHEEKITDYAVTEMSKIDNLVMYGPKEPRERMGIISFNLGKIHPHDVAALLDEEGVAIRSGHHCAQPLMEFLNVPATSRASFYLYNTKTEVDVLMNALRIVRGIFKS